MDELTIQIVQTSQNTSCLVCCAALVVLGVALSNSETGGPASRGVGDIGTLIVLDVA